MRNVIQLHFCFSNRAFALSQHLAYVSGVTDKLIASFSDIETEADQYADKIYEKLCQRPGWEDGPDLADFADMARDSGIEKYDDLVFVKGELIGIATAGLYHLWEKTLKSFYTRELHNYIGTEKLQKKIEGADYGELQSILADDGFDFSERQYADNLDICRLIANTVKHGDGSSCKKLAEKLPELFRGPYELDFLVGEPRAKDLWIDSAKFKECAGSIEAFWNEMPERLQSAELN